MSDQPQPPPPPPPAPSPARPGAPMTRAERDEIFRRANAGDRAVLPALRRLLDAEPALVERNSPAGVLLHDLVAGYRCLAIREAFRRTLDRLRAELSGPAPSPLERLLVERIATCYLSCYRAEMEYEAESGLGAGDYCRKRLDSAHKRLLSSIKCLAMVRKLAPSALQIHAHGTNQINVT